MGDLVGDFPNLEAGRNEAAPRISLARAGPFFERTDWLSFGLTTALVLTIYLFTLSPSIDLDFSGIFATGAMYGGVPHPPGFPLWTIYAHFFTVLLPYSNIAWRIGVSSAVAASLACGLIALMVSRGGALILEGLDGFQRLEARPEKWLRLICGYTAGMSFGLSGSVWSKAVIADSWPLNYLLFAAVVCLLLRWSYAPRKTRYLYAAIFLYGPTLLNTRAPCFAAAAPGLELIVLLVSPKLGRDLLVFTVLVLIYVLFASYNVVTLPRWEVYLMLAILTLLLAIALTIKTRSILSRWQTTLGCALFLALGFSFCFYSAIASMCNPPMNWGYPRTMEGFFHLISRGQYERSMPVHDLSRFGTPIQLYFDILGSDYGWIYLLPAATPFFFLRRLRPPERKLIFSLLALFVCLSFFLLAILNPSNDLQLRQLTKEFYAPSFFMLAIGTGFGLILLGTVATRSKNSGLADMAKPASL